MIRPDACIAVVNSGVAWMALLTARSGLLYEQKVQLVSGEAGGSPCLGTMAWFGDNHSYSSSKSRIAD